MLHPDLKIIAASSHDAGNAALVKAGASAVCGKMEFNGIQAVIEALRLPLKADISFQSLHQGMRIFEFKILHPHKV